MKSVHRRALLSLVAGVIAVGSIVWVSAERSSSGVPDGAQTHALAANLNSAQVSRGAAIYAVNCATCHGAKGEGEPNWRTSNADGTYPAPPHDASGHTWHHSDRLLIELIRDGGARYASGTLKSRMPAFEGRLTDEEMRAVLEFLKSLWGPEERALQAEATSRDP